MRYMDRTDRKVLQRLVRIAGSPLLVEQALRDLNQSGAVPTLEDVVKYILAEREQWHAQRDAAMRGSPREAALV